MKLALRVVAETAIDSRGDLLSVETAVRLLGLLVPRFGEALRSELPEISAVLTPFLAAPNCGALQPAVRRLFLTAGRCDAASAADFCFAWAERIRGEVERAEAGEPRGAEAEALCRATGEMAGMLLGWLRAGITAGERGEAPRGSEGSEGSEDSLDSLDFSDSEDTENTENTEIPQIPQIPQIPHNSQNSQNTIDPFDPLNSLHSSNLSDPLDPLDPRGALRELRQLCRFCDFPALGDLSRRLRQLQTAQLPAGTEAAQLPAGNALGFGGGSWRLLSGLALAASPRKRGPAGSCVPSVEEIAGMMRADLAAAVARLSAVISAGTAQSAAIDATLLRCLPLLETL